MRLDRTEADFHTTCWSLVHSLNGVDPEVRRSCLEELVSRYWPPVYGYLRRQGQGTDQAAENTQAFFADVVLRRELFEKAIRERGRLRSLILVALKNFLIDEGRRETSRGAGLRVPLEMHAAEAAVGQNTGSPEDAFDREWASALLEEAVRRAERHFVQTGKVHHWRLFEARVLNPAATGSPARTLQELAREEEFATPADAAAAVQVVKKRVQVLLEEVVAETVGGAADLSAEVAAIRGALS